MKTGFLTIQHFLYCRHVDGSLNEFTPDIIVYNAGTDILEGDPLGHLNITPNVSKLEMSIALTDPLCCRKLGFHC